MKRIKNAKLGTKRFNNFLAHSSAWISHAFMRLFDGGCGTAKTYEENELGDTVIVFHPNTLTPIGAPNLSVEVTAYDLPEPCAISEKHPFHLKIVLRSYPVIEYGPETVRHHLVPEFDSGFERLEVDHSDPGTLLDEIQIHMTQPVSSGGSSYLKAHSDLLSRWAEKAAELCLDPENGI